MKQINLSNTTLDSIDLSSFDKHLMSKYKILGCMKRYNTKYKYPDGSFVKK